MSIIKLSFKWSMMIALILFMFISSDQSVLAKKQKTLGGEKNGCLALNYHRVREDTWIDKLLSAFSNSKELKIYSVTDKQFEAHIKWLKEKNAQFLSLDEFIHYKEKGKFPKNCVWLNFDDMDQSIYENAFPIMKKYHVQGTGFVITKHVGDTDFHNIRMSSKKDLLKMKSSGLWDFASHTHDMHTMKKDKSKFVLSAEKGNIKQDIYKSTNYIKNELGGNGQAIAYPYGQASDQLVKELDRDTSIKYGFTLEEKAVVPDSDNFYIPRVMVSDDAFNKIVKKWEGFKYE
ncbi:intercellular adhesin biosynthesis polysaccharide N-deacetylase [Mammaliicoccus sciuri]|uniref:intercellular adhesin biosynthesis polysaccharide N-deacetylase n=1 Tax=Mammaliicoccus sciuri TaxID=1296 RepID=UPI000E685EF0|nr:intercellular adhesin biosynthesis polysaccharide N-deacetylase [Mammaliicoccus sciuri]RIN84759.1 intercellular adhesin biosynthesis polysaccharide N-deacetylase [Mammaliicoccus sciuri]